MASRRRGWLWLVAGLIFALVAAFVAMAAVELRVQQSAEAGPAAQGTSQRTPEPVAAVVVAMAHIQPTHLITEGDLSLQEWPVDIIPEGSATSLDDVVGKISMSDIYPGEVVLSMRLADPDVTGHNVAFTMDQDKVVFALAPKDLMSNIHLLKPGDVVDILFSLQPEQEVEATPGAQMPGEPQALGDPLFTTDALQAQRITAIVLKEPKQTTTQAGQVEAPAVPGQAGAEGQRPPTPTPTPPADPLALLVALDPQDALVLKYFIDAGGTMDIVLRHPANEELFDVEPVNYDYIRDRYGLPAQGLVPGR